MKNIFKKTFLLFILVVFFILPQDTFAGAFQSYSISPLYDNQQTTISGTYNYYNWSGGCNGAILLIYGIDIPPEYTGTGTAYGWLYPIPTGSFSFNVGPLSAGAHTLYIRMSKVEQGCISTEFYNPISFTVAPGLPPGTQPSIDILLNNSQQDITLKASYGLSESTVYTEPFTVQVNTINGYTSCQYYGPLMAGSGTNSWWSTSDCSTYATPKVISQIGPFTSSSFLTKFTTTPGVFPRTVSIMMKTRKLVGSTFYDSNTVTRNVTLVAAPAPTVTLSANPTTINYGGQTTLSWSSTDTIGCSTISTFPTTPGLFSQPTFGSQVFTNVTATRTYYIYCKGINQAVIGAQATVSVILPPPPTVSISANPTSVANGNTSTLTWSSTGATSCSSSGSWSGSRPTSGTLVVTPLTSPSTYRLSCNNPGGTTQQSAVVTIQLPTVSFSADPIAVTYGNTTTLTWSSSGATTCAASGAWSGARPTSGTFVVAPTTPTNTYNLTCSNPAGSTIKSSVVTVNGFPPPTLTLSANPTSVNPNTSSTLTWSSTIATSCTASAVTPTAQWSGSKALSNSQSVTVPSGGRTYTLTCTGYGGNTSRSVTVSTNVCGNGVCEQSGGENITTCRADCPAGFEEF